MNASSGALWSRAISALAFPNKVQREQISQSISFHPMFRFKCKLTLSLPLVTTTSGVYNKHGTVDLIDDDQKNFF